MGDEPLKEFGKMNKDTKGKEFSGGKGMIHNIMVVIINII